jgi:hypothetical protein
MNEIIEINTTKTPKMILRKAIGNTDFADIQSIFFNLPEVEYVFDKTIEMFMDVIPGNQEKAIIEISKELLVIGEREISTNEKKKEIFKTLLKFLPLAIKYDVFVEKNIKKNTSYTLWEPWSETLYSFCKRNAVNNVLLLKIERSSEDKKNIMGKGAEFALQSLMLKLINQDVIYKDSEIISMAIEESKPLFLEI